MIASRFRSVCWVGGVAVAALGCYLVSQQVAAERLTLARVESDIVKGRRAIRSLKTELGTRGNLNQIERWNAEVLALQAPKSGQYLRDEVQLAALIQPVQPAMEAPAVVQVAAAVPIVSDEPRITRASYTPEPQPAIAEPIVATRDEAKPKAKEKAKPKRDVERTELAKREPKRAEPKLKAKEKEDKPAKAAVRLAKAEPAAEVARLRPAVYVKPGREHQNVALLDDRLLGDLTRIAARERNGGKRER